MKRLRLLLVLAFLGLSMGLVTAQSWTGSGTEASPYKITSASDLQALATYVNAGNTCAEMYFEMTTDIDLSSVCGEGIGNWTPIGTATSSFMGVFDGQNYVIHNLYINQTEESEEGFALFGNATSAELLRFSVTGEVHVLHIGAGIVANATVCRLEDCFNLVNVHGELGGTIDNAHVGGIVAVGFDCTITGCGNLGNVDGEQVGGIIGFAQVMGYGGTIENCFNDGNISGDTHVGGIAGVAYGIDITSCFNSGEVNFHYYSQHPFACAGGLVGALGGCSVEYSYNAGRVVGLGVSGGLVGVLVPMFWQEPAVRYCYNVGQVECVNTTAGEGAGEWESAAYAYSGALVGVVQPDEFATVCTVSHCYYDRQMCPRPGEGDGIGHYSDDSHINMSDCAGMLTESMLGSSLIANLGTGSNWTSKVHYYPQLTVFSDSHGFQINMACSEVSAKPVHLRNEETADLVTTSPFEVCVQGGGYWTSTSPYSISHKNVTFTESGMGIVTANMDVTIHGANVVAKKNVYLMAEGSVAAVYWPEAVRMKPSGYVENGNEIYILDKEGLAWLISVVNGYNGQTARTLEGYTVTLTADVDMSEYLWMPIGISVPFSGVFSGQGNTVSGIVLDKPADYTGIYGSGAEYNNQGLFGCIRTATIEDVIIAANCQIVGLSNVGALVAGYTGETSYIRNCENNANVSGLYCVGGLVGDIYGRVENCTNHGTVSSLSSKDNVGLKDSEINIRFIGGILGYNEDGLVTGCTNTGDVVAEGGFDVGGIAGFMKGGGLVDGCSNSGNVSADDKVGGIIGSSSKRYANCSNSGNITGRNYVGGICSNQGAVNMQEGYAMLNCSNSGTITGRDYVGGLSGANGSDGSKGDDPLEYPNRIKDCSNTGAIVLSRASGAAGGLVGTATFASFIACVNEGDVRYVGVEETSDGAIAGICGTGHGVHFTDCVNRGTIDGTIDTGPESVGGIVGDFSSSAIFSCRVSSCRNEGNIIGVFAGGIQSLVCDETIDCVNVGTVEGYEAGGIASVPTDHANSSTVLVGCKNYGHVVAMARGYAGGITATWHAGSIENCINYGVVECAETEDPTFDDLQEIQYECLGGIVARLIDDAGNGARVTSCVNNGLVKGGLYEGGICGYVAVGEVNTYVLIDSCINLGQIEGNAKLSIVGGLASNISVETVTRTVMANSYNAGMVYGSFVAGGLVGYSEGILENCINVGYVSDVVSPVTELGYNGGLVGLMCNDGVVAEVNNSYYDKQMCPRVNEYYFAESLEYLFSAMPVVGPEDIALLTAVMTDGSWNPVGSAFTPSMGLYPQLKAHAESADGDFNDASTTAATPAFLVNEENVEGVTANFTVGTTNVTWSHVSGDEVLSFDGENVSVTETGTEMLAVTCGDAVKHIRMTTEYSDICWAGSGTEDDPYQIVDAAGLVCLAEKVNGGEAYAGVYFKMMNDIDLSSVCGEGVGNWTPIGMIVYGGSTDKPFSGHFDGDSHVISNLYINAPTLNHQGLFGYAEYATITGVCLKESSVRCLGGAGICGSLRGSSYGDEKTAVISNCTNYAKIVAMEGDAGGVVGSVEYGLVSHCSNYGNITHGASEGTPRAAGGVCGDLSESILEYCMNAAEKVESEMYAGGVVGNAHVSEISHSFNTGIVAWWGSPDAESDVPFAGGVLGAVYRDVVLTDCYNTGIVVARAVGGGLVGAVNFYNLEIHNSYNAGLVMVDDFEWEDESMTLNLAGGLVGAVYVSTLTIDNCYYDKQMCPLPYVAYDPSTFEGVEGNAVLTSALTDGSWNPDESAFYAVSGLYPELKYFHNTPASTVSVTPAFLQNEEDVLAVKSDFTVGTNNVTWSHVNEDEIVLDFSGSNVSVIADGSEITAVTCEDVSRYVGFMTIYEPVLTWVDVVTSEPAGFNPYDIDSPEDLAWFISYVNGFNGCEAHPTAGGEITADIDMSEHWWVPIGFECNNITSYEAPFAGAFNGGHHNIDGIRIDWLALSKSPAIRALPSSKNNAKDSYDYLGMFGRTLDANIYNVILASGDYVGAVENRTGDMGGLIGKMEGGTLNQCVVNVKMTRYRLDAMGGIVGSCEEYYPDDYSKPVGYPAFIANCMSTSEMIGYGAMGGIIGDGYGFLLSNCYANAKFTVRESAGSKEDSFESMVGGLIGGGEDFEVQNCYVNLRPDSDYGLTKDSGGDHVFGLFSGYVRGENFHQCYAPEGTGYEYVGMNDSYSYQFERATTYEELRTNTKGETFDIALASRISGNTYFVASSLPEHVINGYVSESETVGEKEVIAIEDKTEWEMESHLYPGDDTDKFDFHDSDWNTLRCDSEGVLQTEYDPSYCFNWRIEEVNAGKAFGGFRIINWDYDTYSLALHNLGGGNYEIKAFDYELYKNNPDYNFAFDIFIKRGYEQEPNLYGCGVYSAASSDYTYTDPKGGNIVTLDEATEGGMYVVSGETTLLDALNNWAVANYDVNVRHNEPDWGRFGSPLNGDLPAHAFYVLDNVVSGDDVSPTPKVISTADKTNGFPFRYYHRVSEALSYYNAADGGGVVCVYGSDDMRGASAKSNDADVDVYVNGMTFMHSDIIKHAGDFYWLSSTALENSSQWYVSLLQDEDAALTVRTGVMLDNSDASGEVGGGAYDWHMVSSPLSGVPVGISYSDEAQHPYLTPASCTWNTSLDGLFPTDTPLGSYDFYAYSEPDYHWINLKQNSASHYHQDGEHAPIAYTNETKLLAGHGYLVAMDKEVFMQYGGQLNNGDVKVPVTCEGAHNKGLNFLGNPYLSSLDFEAFVGENGTLWNGGDYAASYMILNADQKYYETYVSGQSVNPDAGSRYVWPNQGFYIAADASGTAVFTNEMRVIKSDAAGYFRGETVNYPLVNLKATGSDGRREMVTVEMGRPEQGGARKVKDMENGHGVMYASVEGKEYSVLFSTEGTNSVPVWFETREDDTYTMTWSAYNGTFQYLHLVDNMTGADVDMLTNTEYRFVSKTTDYQSRFRLQFAYTGVEEDQGWTDSQFVFQSGGNLVVTGEGEVEVVDVNGRVLSHVRTTGVQTLVSMPETAEGLYLVRLLGNDGVKVNKIVVRR